MMDPLKRLVRHARRFARDVRGDTIAETLVAVLIAALGAAALATMVMVSVNVSTSMEQQRSRIYTAESSMLPGPPGFEGNFSIAVDDKSTDLKVRVYRDTDDTFISYIDESISAG